MYLVQQSKVEIETLKLVTEEINNKHMSRVVEEQHVRLWDDREVVKCPSPAFSRDGSLDQRSTPKNKI